MIRHLHIAHKILLRIIFLPLIFAVLLFAAAAFVMNTMFTQKDLESLVTDQLQQVFKRPVRIKSATLSLSGVKIKDLNVIEPGPGSVNFITADYIDASYRLLPLLQKNLVLDRITLVSPRIELIKRSTGGWNFSDIIDAYRESSSKSGFLNRLDSAEIKDGIINITYPGVKFGHSFENVNFAFRNYTPGSETPFYLSAFFKRKDPAKYLDGRFYAEGALNLRNFDLALAEINNLAVTVTISGRSLSAKGRLQNLRRPQLDMTASLQSVTAKDLAPLFKPPWDFSLPATVWDLHAGLSEDYKLTVLARAETPVPSPNGFMRFSTRSGVFDLRLPVTALNLQAGLSENRTLTFTARAEPLKAAAEGFVRFDSTGTAYDISVQGPPFAFAALKNAVRIPYVDSASGKTKASLRMSNKDGAFKVVSLSVNLDRGELNYRPLHFKDLDLAAAFFDGFKTTCLNATGGTLTLRNASLTNFRMKTEFSREKLTADYAARWGRDPLKGTVTVYNPLSNKRTGSLTGYSRNLDIVASRDLIIELTKVKVPDKNRPVYDSELAWLKILKNSIPAGYTSFGLLYKADHIKHQYLEAKDFYLGAKPRDITGRIEDLRGDFSIKTGEGVFYDVQKNADKDRIHYLFSLPVLTLYRLNRMGALKFGYKLNDVHFRSIAGDFSFERGILQIRNFYMDGKEFSLYMSGTANLSAETSNLKVYTISDKYYSMGGLPEALTDSSGKPALAFTIKGKMTEPDVNVLSPKESGAIIDAAISKGVDIDIKKADQFAGGK